MSLLRHHHDHQATDEDQLTGANYDAQTDLALPTHGHRVDPVEVLAPYAGEVIPTDSGPGYDVGRDTGL